MGERAEKEVMKEVRVNMVILKIGMEVSGRQFEKVYWFQTREGFKGQERYFRDRIMTFHSWHSKGPLYT